MTNHARHRNAPTGPAHRSQTAFGRASFGLRLTAMMGLIVGATLATAVGSTAITELVLAATAATGLNFPTTPPTTRPAVRTAIAPATTQPADPTDAAAPSRTPGVEVLAMIDAAPVHAIDASGLGIESHFSGDSPVIAAASGIAAGGAAGGGSSSPRAVAPVRDAFAQNTAHAQPMTFGGSPELADAYRSFQTQAIDAAGYDAPESSRADAVPALGMDDPNDTTTDPRKTAAHKPVRRINSLPSVTDSLPSEAVIAARPNGEIPPSGAGTGRAIDPFDGGGRASMHGTMAGTGTADPASFGDSAGGNVLAPEPTTLASAVGAVATLSVRRRRDTSA